MRPERRIMRQQAEARTARLRESRAVSALGSACLPVPPRPIALRSLPHGKQWRGYPGAQARARALLQSFARVLKLRDEASRAALACIHEAVAEEDDRTAAAQQFAHRALLIADEERIPWAEAVARLARQLEESAAPGPVA